MPSTKIADRIFSSIHSNNLVYNTCWEDPRCDRQLLDLKADSNIVMITSAGCNALDYALNRPGSIHCIDVNPRQNALLELKLASIENGNFNHHFSFFGSGVHHDAEAVYQEELRPKLPGFAQAYWDKNINFFNGKGVRKTFYHYGTSGTFAFMVNKYLKTRKKLFRNVKDFFAASNMKEQQRLYYQIEPKVLNKFVGWALNKHLTMCLLGVPKSQQELFKTEYEKGALGFIQECLRKVFTTLPIQENYFYQLYINGKYTKDCCPEYLRAANFEVLQEQSNKINTYTTTISDFLKKNPGPYSHYVLLDHQDWLAANAVDALEEEWQLILENSKPGTKILLRSAALEVDFFPDFVKDRLEFEKELTAKTHQEDRVGTYASVYMGIVK